MVEYYEQIIECKTGRTGKSIFLSWDMDKYKFSGGHSPSATPSSIPILFILNKTDLPPHKWQVTVEEVRSLLSKVVPKQNSTTEFMVACSARTNENVMRAFGRVFTMGKLPKYMNPEQHKVLRNELSADGVVSGDKAGKKPVLQRMRSKFSRDCDDEM